MEKLNAPDLRKLRRWQITLFCIPCVTMLFSQPQDSVVHKINRIMDPLINSNNYAGNVVIVKDGETLFSRSYGMMDEENQMENTDETRFILASASMIFTSAAIMKLVDGGMMAVTDKLSKYFPEFKNGDRITIHHMLAQRSGIPAWDAGFSVYNLNRNTPHAIEELIDYFKNDDLLFEPGSNYAHGRSEYILLAAIVEKVSGLSFGDYLKQSIFEPLGMNNSGHYSHSMNDNDVPNLAKGYTEKDFTDVTSAPKIHWSVKTGHASIYSTVGDLQKFARAVLDVKLLSEDSWNLVLTNYGSNAGYGWFLNPQGEHKRYQMNGRSPGFSSYFGIYPDDGLVVIMLSNRYVSLPFFIGPELASAVFGDPYEVLKLSTKDVDRELADQITGSYKMGADFYRPNGTVKIRYRNGRMYSGSYPLIPVLDDEGKISGFIHRHYWSRLVFEKDANENVQLHFDDYSGNKKGFLETWKWVLISGISVSFLVWFVWRRKRKSKERRLATV